MMKLPTDASDKKNRRKIIVRTEIIKPVLLSQNSVSYKITNSQGIKNMVWLSVMNISYVNLKFGSETNILVAFV